MSPATASEKTAPSRLEPPGDRYFRYAFTSMRCGIITIDTRGRVTSINDLARKILEVSHPDPVGLPCAEVLREHPKLAGILVESFRLKNQPNRAEMEIRLRDERKRTIGFSMPPIRDDDGNVLGAALLFRDLTQIEHHEEQEKLKERLAALGQMAAGMAHEIRNPLGGIEVTASLLRRRLTSRPEEVGLLDRILNEVKRLNRTVSDSLEYVRPLHLDRKTATLDAVVREALRQASAALEDKTIEVGLEMDPRIPPLWIDPDRLRDALINLIKNAFEAIPRTGTVRVETRHERNPGAAPEPASEHGSTAPSAVSSYAVVRIADTGKGIPEEMRDRLFYPFFTTKQSGSGVGLPLAKKIIEGHRGIIDFESEVGCGTTFVVKIPVHSPPSLGPGSGINAETEHR